MCVRCIGKARKDRLIDVLVKKQRRDGHLQDLLVNGHLLLQIMKEKLGQPIISRFGKTPPHLETVLSAFKEVHLKRSKCLLMEGANDLANISSNCFLNI